jgi:hypothetical protein
MDGYRRHPGRPAAERRRLPPADRGANEQAQRVRGVVAQVPVRQPAGRQARRARAALRSNWREPRAAIALAAVTGVVRVEDVLSSLHRRGRGI